MVPRPTPAPSHPSLWPSGEGLKAAVEALLHKHEVEIAAVKEKIAAQAVEIAAMKEKHEAEMAALQATVARLAAAAAL